MSRSKHTVDYLAREANIDPEEVLLLLWDGGLGYLRTAGSKVRNNDMDRARTLLGMLSSNDLASVAAWQRALELNAEEFRGLQTSLGLEFASAGKLRSRSIRKLEAHARSRRHEELRPAPITTDRPKGLESDKNRATKEIAAQSLEWRPIGQQRKIVLLSLDDILAIHMELVGYFAGQNDPIDPPGVRDSNLLASALFRPETSLGIERKYPTVEMAAAALLHALIHDHPFHNGNKRTALVAMLAFLDANGLLMTCDEEQLFRQVLRIARHALVQDGAGQLTDRETLAIAAWIKEHTRQIELGDRPIPFRKLRKLLSRYECGVDTLAGSRANISRSIERKRLLLRPKIEKVSCQIPYGGEGREVGKGTMARIRKDLQLDEENGTDSASFYDNAPAVAGEFIEQFRKTLLRLSRL